MLPACSTLTSGRSHSGQPEWWWLCFLRATAQPEPSSTDMFDNVNMICRWWLLPISLLSNLVVVSAGKLWNWCKSESTERGWIASSVLLPLRITVFGVRCVVGVYLSIWVCTGVRLLQMTVAMLCRGWLLKLTTGSGDRGQPLSALAREVAWG